MASALLSSNYFSSPRPVNNYVHVCSLYPRSSYDQCMDNENGIYNVWDAQITASLWANQPVSGGFFSQMVCNATRISKSWCLNEHQTFQTTEKWYILKFYRNDQSGGLVQGCGISSMITTGISHAVLHQALKYAISSLIMGINLIDELERNGMNKTKLNVLKETLLIWWKYITLVERILKYVYICDPIYVISL